MKLVAGVRAAEVELDRYLEPCLEHLLEFCDHVVLVCEDPEGAGWGSSLRGNLTLLRAIQEGSLRIAASELRFYDHEGQARQSLNDLALTLNPTHVLSIDADEFITDGAAVRAANQDNTAAAWTACMEEVWHAEANHLLTRQDGGWIEHDITVLWAPQQLPYPLRMPDRALACGRVPEAAAHAPTGCLGTSILHFGWANESDRARRHARYVQHDGGQYHASAHLDSILAPDPSLVRRPWPVAWTNRRTHELCEAARKIHE